MCRGSWETRGAVGILVLFVNADTGLVRELRLLRWVCQRMCSRCVIVRTASHCWREREREREPSFDAEVVLVTIIR